MLVKKIKEGQLQTNVYVEFYNNLTRGASHRSGGRSPPRPLGINPDFGIQHTKRLVKTLDFHVSFHGVFMGSKLVVL